MNATGRFLSYAQNREDVVLWRALGHVANGRYVDVGANDPTEGSVSRAFYEHGWSGVAVEPDSSFAERFRVQRPRDIVVEAVVTDATESSAVLHRFEGTGLSTLVDGIRDFHLDAGLTSFETRVPALSLDSVIEGAGMMDEEIHFLSIDTEGSEESVLRSVNFRRIRPWVVVVEATAPNTTTRTHLAWEPLLLDAGYEFCLFDGLSRFYVAEEHRHLASSLDYPACVFDEFQTMDDLAREAELLRVHRAVADEASRADRAEAELERMRATVSWRMTVPLRRMHRPVDPHR